MSNFDGFLKKMMGETDEPKRVNLREGASKGGGVKPLSSTPRPPVKPQSQKPQRQEPINESEDDDIVERAFEYAATFSKIVKKNFPDKSSRRIVLESVRSAINMMLGESTGSVSQASNARMPMVDPNPPAGRYEPPEVEGDPYDILRRAQTSRLPEDFNPNAPVEGDLGIKGVMNEKGETEVDLSSMTAESMHALRVLSGIEDVPGKQVPKEAEEEIQAVMNG